MEFFRGFAMRTQQAIRAKVSPYTMAFTLQGGNQIFGIPLQFSEIVEGVHIFLLGGVNHAHT